ncbi:MAG: cytochrome b/b6 domain-containing protein [Burkholderiaceae bacterium]|jgi:cytochrome b|nr:cytochrome b/b6 domain-containing protein [Burkholderiaceae bacterium]
MEHTQNIDLMPIRVWDWTVRVSHWTLAVSFITAYATSESESLRLIHNTAGLMTLAAVIYRVAWGFVGSRHARFSAFLYSPVRAVVYLKSLTTQAPDHFTGHNPAGGWAVIGLLALALLTAGTGLANDLELGGSLVEKAHDVFANLAIAMVALHLVAVAASSFLHKENLVKPMLWARKMGQKAEEIPAGAGLVSALVFVVWIAAFVMWLR